MHKVFVQAIYENGDVTRIWAKLYDSHSEAIRNGIPEAKNAILADLGFTKGVSFYQLCYPIADGCSHRSRFITVCQSMSEVNW